MTRINNHRRLEKHPSFDPHLRHSIFGFSSSPAILLWVSVLLPTFCDVFLGVLYKESGSEYLLVILDLSLLNLQVESSSSSRFNGLLVSSTSSKHSTSETLSHLIYRPT
jgi:hypothetical protein